MGRFAAGFIAGSVGWLIAYWLIGSDNDTTATNDL